MQWIFHTYKTQITIRLVRDQFYGENQITSWQLDHDDFLYLVGKNEKFNLGSKYDNVLIKSINRILQIFSATWV